MSGRVFMPQRPVYRDGPRWVDKYDLSPAERWGRLVHILPLGQGVSDPGTLSRCMEKALADFDGDDLLLSVGDPFAIALMVLTAARVNAGCVRLLKWDRNAGEYVEHSARV